MSAEMRDASGLTPQQAAAFDALALAIVKHFADEQRGQS